MGQANADELCVRLAADLDANFADMVIEHQALVFGVALRVVRDPAAAEDVAQDAFVRAYRAMWKYPEERIREMRLRPWLARMALNLARNAIRGRRTEVDLADVQESQPSSDDEPVQLIQRREDHERWARLLGGLPRRYGLAVALRHVDGLSYAELAETLGRPMGSVKSDVHRGTALLRAAYEAEQRLVTSREAV